MGTIIPRKRNDGTTAYRAQIVVKREGKVVHRENETLLPDDSTITALVP